MRVVVTEPGSVIRVRDGGLVVSRRGGDVVVPPGVEQIVVATRAATVTGAAVAWMAERGVDLVFVSGRGDLLGRLYYPFVNRTVASRAAQYRLAQGEFGLRVAMEMVASKVFNQAQVLRYLARAWGVERLREDSYRVDAVAGEIEALKPGQLSREALRELEARAARLYWSSIAAAVPGDYGFTGRIPRGGDPLNTALSYGYAILYGAAERGLVIAGLDPYMGVLHADKSGRPSLTYDYSDMFKPVAVDRVVLGRLGRLRIRVENGVLDREARRSLAAAVLEGFERRLRIRGRRRRLTLGDALLDYAWRLARSFREEEPYEGLRVYL